MGAFQDLPTETRILTTCKTFRLLAQEILSHPYRHPAGPPLVPARPRSQSPEQGETTASPSSSTSPPSPTDLVNPVLAHDFAPLFSSAACFTAAERARTPWFLSLNGDVTRPFRRLPWASCGRGRGRGSAHGGGSGDEDDGGSAAAPGRDAYLLPGASWRGLSVTFARGPPVTRLEVVKSYSSERLSSDGRDHVQHLLVDLSPSGGLLTMGLLWDLLLCGGGVGDGSAATFGRETGAWDLLLGRRLRSYGLLAEYECFIADDEDLVDSGPGAQGSAILYVRGGTVEVDDQDRRFAEPEDDGDGGWVPEMLVGVPRIQTAAVL